MSLPSPAGADTARRHEKVPLGIWAAAVFLVCSSAPFLLWAGTLFHEDIVNTPVHSGQLYLGDGTGFVLGSIGALPGLVFLGAGLGAPVLWRRGSSELAVGLLIVTGCVWALTVLGVVAFWT